MTKRPNHILIRAMEARIAKLKREILHLETKGKSPEKIQPLYKELKKIEKEIVQEKKNA